ncbi:MAG TPA: ABC transporter ATP-binding protein [Candidatus Saccharimonadales bacterium]|nr:ABC transporter ATP-binding protein [Candidatus Saccharimonadales bacterium]
MTRASNGRDKEITRQIHRFFWRANAQDKVALALCYLLRIPAVAAYNVFIPLVSAYAIQAIMTQHFDRVLPYAIWVVVLSLAYSVLWSGGGAYVSRNAIVGCKYIQNHIFTNFLQKDYEFYGNAFFGSLGAQAARMRDAYNNYGEVVTLSVPKQATIILVGVAVIGYQSILLAVATVLIMLCVLSFTLWSSSWRLKYRRLLGEASSEIAADIGDALTHGTTVKSFAMEGYEEQHLQPVLSKWGRAQYRSWISALPGDNGRMMLTAIATGVLLLLSAHLYQRHAISITIVVLIQLYVIKLVASTIDIAEIVKRYEEAMGMAYEPMRTMLIPTVVNDPSTPQLLNSNARHLVALQKVSFAYPEALNKLAVKDFNLVIQPGEKIGLVGYSGSGKTTLTKLLMRFMDVTSGRLTIDGIDVRELRQTDLRARISYVPQEPLLFHRSVYENIQYGDPAASKDAVMQAAHAAYVDEFASELPQGYDTLVGERGVKLSGGQRQRVAIARALLRNAPILVLDEATSALDSHSEKLIQEALWKLMKDRTAIVVAHRLSTIQRMDRIVVMDKGKIVQVGTHAQLLKQKQGIYAELWAHQSGGYVGLPGSADELVAAETF